ncbi:Nucleolar pre-ribosomal-associated protein 1, N-terminal [Sesbania bispinosa]|nr:Nucleolar pre-ribosomal-associated protein 1, N-terminal [Sesbania bispinosa]
MEAEAAGGGGGSAMLNLQLKVSHEAKLKELLHRITSVEIKLCSDATKEFVKLLKGEDGGELLREYLRGSPKCSELLEAWKLRQGKQGMHYIFQLISTILSHREGKHTSNLDKFARLLLAEYLNDVYKELNSKEVKRQKAALSLAASIVRRGSSVASEVAKSFDFKLGGFSALAAAKKRRNGEGRGEGLLRKSFVGFAMSFLEVGKPGLLRWVLQQREMYSGVLRGLVNDDEETVVFVLSTLRDRVLVEESLVPPGLRSVLFGSVTLEQLVEVCGREGGGAAAELAFEVLVMVCTDPSNGLMPDSKKRPNPLRGNPKRIMGLMKKLWATDFQYHRDLLLAIVNARPSFGLSYLKEFPYNIENYKLSSWISAISLAADLVSSVSNGLSKEFINPRSNDPHSFDNMDLHNIVKCLFPRPFSRSMFNKGLHHTDSYVKHGTLRLLMELLKLLDSLFGGLDHNSSSGNPFMQHVVSVKQEIQNYVQAFLPDLQVLFNLLSSLDACSEAHNSSLKRNACHHEHNSNSRKKLKMDTSESDIDIIVGGISAAPDIDFTGNNGTVGSTLRADALDDAKDIINSLGEIWGVDLRFMAICTLEDAESYLLSKLLDTLRYYRRTLPFSSDNSIESFKGLLKNPLDLTSHLQVSLLSLLVEYIEWCPDNEIPIRTPPMLYKYLQPFIKVLMFSPVNGTKDLAYRLAMAAVFSTGAFDRNLHEIEAWFLFLPGYHRKKSAVNIMEVDVLQSLTFFVISFLCDAVSTLGNNLVKYWNILKNYVHCLKGGKDLSPDFSPFIICVLEKCLKVIRSKSGTCSLPKKSMVNAELLSALVNADLTEKLSGNYEYDDVFPEWTPLKNLLNFVESISHQRSCCLFYENEESVPLDGSLGSALGDVNRSLSSRAGNEMAETTMAFISSIIFEDTDKTSMELPSSVLLELVDWMFSRVEMDDLPTRIPALSVGCSLAADAFSALSIYFQQSTGNRVPHWKSFLSKDIFEEEYGEFFPSSVQELLCLIDNSLLGKSIQMLQCHFALDGDSVKLKKRLKLVKSICPKFASHDELLDCDSQVIDNYSLHQSLNIINRVVAKISLCKMLLFHEEAGGDLKDVAVEMQSKLEASKIHFINILVDIWQFIVKKFSLASDQTGTGKSANISLLYNHLEVFVLKNILELAVEMQNDLIQLQSIPFIEQLIRLALLYRFDDPMTMKTLRVILTQLNEGRLSYDLHLQLLLAHSQFASTLHSLHKPAGSFLKPVSSILKCLVIPSLDHYENDEKHKEPTTELSRGPLEIVKLLWILWTKARQTGSGSGNDIGINLKELHALLQNSYGATLSQIDLVIYNLMQQIEAVNGSWSPNVELNSEAIEEWTRSQHRDNFPIDPDICVSTVLYFPYDRSISDELPSVNKIEMDYVRKKVEACV